MAAMPPPPLPARYRDDEAPWSVETSRSISSRYEEWKRVCARSSRLHVPEIQQKDFLSEWLDDPSPERYHRPAQTIFYYIRAAFTEDVLEEVFIETLGQMVEEVEPWIKQSLRRLDNAPYKCRRWFWQQVTWKDDVQNGQARPWAHLWYNRETEESVIAGWIERKDKTAWVDNLILLRDELHYLIRIMKKLQRLEELCLLKYQGATREEKLGFRSEFPADFFPRRIHQGGSGH